MKGRIFSFSIFSLLCIFTLVACGNKSELSSGNDDGAGESTNKDDKSSNNVFDYQIIKVNSVGKKFDNQTMCLIIK